MLQRNIPYHQQILESYADLSMMKGSRWVPKALRHFQEFVGVEEYSFAITLKLCFYLFAFTPMPVFNTGIKMYLNAVLLFAAIRDEFVRGFPITIIVIQVKPVSEGHPRNLVFRYTSSISQKKWEEPNCMLP